MQYTISEKEKYFLVKIEETKLTTQQILELKNFVEKNYFQQSKNVVVDLCCVLSFDEGCADELLNIQQKFQEQNISFWMCIENAALRKNLKPTDDEFELNIAPTQSEASDMVLMETMEREMFE